MHSVCVILNFFFLIVQMITLNYILGLFQWKLCFVFARKDLAKEIWDMRIQTPGNENGSRQPWWRRELKLRERASSMRIKSNGDKGSPCLTPLEAVKKPTGLPLIRTEKLLYLSEFPIKWQKWGLNPKERRTCWRKGQETKQNLFACPA